MDFELFDPAGRLVQESYDYGFTDYQHVGVHNPTPGTWTEKILWNNGRDHFQEPLPTAGSYRGAVSGAGDRQPVRRRRYAAGDEDRPGGRLGNVRPDRAAAAQAGDAPASIQFDSNLGTHLTVPAARRVLIPAGGSFGITITGGVGAGVNQYSASTWTCRAGNGT